MQPHREEYKVLQYMNMHIVKRAAPMYVNHMQNVIDNCTVEDARNMGIPGSLPLIAGIVDAVRAF